MQSTGSDRWLPTRTSLLALVSAGIVGITILVGRIYANRVIDTHYKDYLSRITQRKRSRGLLHRKYIKNDIVTADVIIIGSGMGGLSCAAILARLGYKVLVLEQHPDVCGGGTHSFDIKGYRFDSGLHYTVPWSVPLFALTCYKKPADVTPFILMGEPDGTVDKIYLVPPSAYTSNTSSSHSTVEPFKMKHGEKHIPDLKTLFLPETTAIDQYLQLASNAMTYVKLLVFSRLLPKWLQRIYWHMVPGYLQAAAASTAKQLLPSITSSKKLISLLSSMWIDTGARPDVASFMLTGAVFRGVSMEGGSYPAGGSETMAKELVAVIEEYGGSVLIKATVDEILFDERLRVSGVRMEDGEIISTRRVVSSCGVKTTFNRLVPTNIQEGKIKAQSKDVQQSCGFVMCNIGINTTAEMISATNTNTWHIPVDAHDDIFPPLDQFFNDPLSPSTEVPAFITFPSLKDKDWAIKFPNKTTCQMLVMAKYEWFEKFRGGDSSTGREEGYEQCKLEWAEKCKQIFLRYFPEAESSIYLLDVSTPLTIETYLNSYRGGAVGLDVTPERFTDPSIMEALDPVTELEGLYLTGQDTMLCGVTLAQLSGVVTALRMEGISALIKILFASILLGDRKTHKSNFRFLNDESPLHFQF